MTMPVVDLLLPTSKGVGKRPTTQPIFGSKKKSKAAVKPTEDLVDVDSDSDAQSQGGGDQGKATTPIHTVRLSMKSGSASLFRRTVNPVALVLVVTPPVDAEEIKELSSQAAIRRAINSMFEAFILASSGSRRLDEGHDDTQTLLVDLKRKRQT
ncbi:unnamed protein product [Cuscuta epithymum]|uniref:Uncharacterized protein n=1 Tax=Cuscuta epithymum TaxID=186058 RepID=A0AAV0DHX6_9ASTE|nr:unnamed protein product [Cuscuta epithymum]